MYFDRFDIVEAHFAFYADNWSGQFCPFYIRQCRIRDYFNPGPCFEGFESLSENGKAIYEQLVDRHC